MIDVAVLIIAYRRPDCTLELINALKKIAPARVYFSVDAPDPLLNEENICNRVKGLVSEFDWGCKVSTRFSKEHLSVSRAIPDSIDWFFENEEEGIILEDDCIPSPSFFHFTSELLDKYRGDPRVMHISANSYIDEKRLENASYYFSNHSHIWGWATWKESWKHFHYSRNNLTQKRLQSLVNERFKRKTERTYWILIYKYLKSGNLDTWDYYWKFTIWDKGGFCITPTRNMIRNIGFGKSGTNTLQSHNLFSNLIAHDLSFPIKHETTISIRSDFDEYVSDVLYKVSKSSKLFHLKLRLARYISKPLKRWIKTHIIK